MPLAIGTDEAGYAPNLGPLVVCATAWRVPERGIDFGAALADHVRSRPVADDPRPVIADSKLVYRAGDSLDLLESSVLALLAQGNVRPGTIAQLVELVCGSGHSIPVHYAWADERLPLAADRSDVTRRSSLLSVGFRGASIELQRLIARLVFPDEFNQLVEVHGNKAAVLSAITLQLVADLLRDGPQEDCTIVCDRHGGRARYAPLVQQFLTENWLQVVEENSRTSRYTWSDARRQCEIEFRVGGESFLPTAAASMTAKYLRELMMAGWNGFWQQHDRDLRPTAGYPLDARRFLRDVRPHLQRLGIGDESIWRRC
jgi:hypothetical protein